MFRSTAIQTVVTVMRPCNLKGKTAFKAQEALKFSRNLEFSKVVESSLAAKLDKRKEKIRKREMITLSR